MAYTTEVIQHTADKGIRVEADTLEELFRAALEGMARIQFEEGEPSGEPVSRQVKVTAPDKTALLVDFLSEVHTLSDIHNAVFDRITFKRFSETELEGQIEGKGTEIFDEDIKAVTHSQADIRENNEGKLATIVVFDI